MSDMSLNRRTLFAFLMVVLVFTPKIGILGAFENFPTLQTSGDILTSTSSKDGLLRGVNISPRDFWSSSKITASDFLRISRWGMDHVRLYLHWHMVEPSRDNPGVYNEGLLSQVDKYVTWADSAGLSVVLGVSKANDGGDGWIYWDEFFKVPEIRGRFYDLWTMLITRYSVYQNIIGYTPMHVPGHKVNNLTALGLYQDLWHNTIIPDVMSRIREINPNVAIVYEPVLPYPKHFETLVPISDNNVYYSFNFYEPYSVTHKFGEYVKDKSTLENSYWWQSIINFGNKYDVPLYCGEFGIEIRGEDGLQEPPSASRQLWVQHTIELFEENNVHWTYWIYGYDRWGFDLLNADGSERAVVDILKEFTLS